MHHLFWNTVYWVHKTEFVVKTIRKLSTAPQRQKTAFFRNVGLTETTTFGCLWHFLTTECGCCQDIPCRRLHAARQKRPHTIGDILILPCAIDNIVRIMLGEAYAKKKKTAVFAPIRYYGPASRWHASRNNVTTGFGNKGWAFWTISNSSGQNNGRSIACASPGVFLIHSWRDYKGGIPFARFSTTAHRRNWYTQEDERCLQKRRLTVDKSLWCVHWWGTSHVAVPLWIPILH